MNKNLNKSLARLLAHSRDLLNKVGILGFLCIAFNLPAQNAQLHFRNYTTDHGLPSSEVHCIFEDSKGYMWFGTDNGASRFDGYEFENFGAQEGLTSNVVFKIMEDSDGRILFGTMTVEVFVFDGDSIRPWEHNEQLSLFNGNNREAFFYHSDRIGNIFIGIGYTGICKFGNSDISFLKLPNNGVLNLHIDEATYSLGPSGLCQEVKVFFVDKDLILTTGHKFKNCLRNEPLSSFTFSDSTSIIITNDSIFYFDATSRIGKIQKFDFDKSIILKDNEERLWFGFTNGNGIKVYKDKSAIINSEFKQYLEDKAILTLYQTKNKEIWIGTRENGIYIAGTSRQKIMNGQSGLNSDHVSSIEFFDSNSLLLGTNKGEIQILNTNSFEIKDLSYPDLRFGSNYIYDIAYVNDKIWVGNSVFSNNLWVPTSRLGLPKITFKKYFLTKEKKNIWLMGPRQLLKFNLESSKLIFDSKKALKHIIMERTFSLLEHQNKIFIGNTNGLFELKNDSLIKLPVNHPSFNIRVEDIDQLPNGDITFGTKGRGLAIWRNDTIIDLNTDHGLASNMVEDVHVDKFGYIWVATLNGMSKVDFDTTNNTAKIRTFTIHNGLPSNEVYQIKSYDGQVWVCTAKGLLKWEDPPINAVSKRPMIIKIVQNNLNLDTSNHALKFNQNNFEFNYLTINIKQDGNIPYRYRLRESDDWTYSSNRSVNYPELRPGQYTFEVQSQNEDYFWSQSASYDFSINKPWWQQVWFLGLTTLGLGGLVYLFYRNRIRTIRQEQEVVKLQQSALQAQMNPHFIFNCLNSIQSYINQNDKNKANLYLVSFARLVRGCLSASREKKIPLDQELGILENYLELEKMRFKDAFNYSIQVDENINKFDTAVPPMMVQPFVENAILHGLSSERNDGLIEIHFTKVDNELQILVRDNGQGIRKNGRQKLNSQNPLKDKYYKSVGITITKKRLELLQLRQPGNR